MKSFRADTLKRLQDALNSYQFLEEDRLTSLARMAIDSEGSVSYNAYDKARAFWDEKMREEGKRLAANVEGFLYDSYREDKPPNA